MQGGRGGERSSSTRSSHTDRSRLSHTAIHVWLWHDVTHVETTTHERSGISCGTGPDHALGPVVVGVLTGLYIGLTDDACGVSPVAPPPDPLLSHVSNVLLLPIDWGYCTALVCVLCDRSDGRESTAVASRTLRHQSLSYYNTEGDPLSAALPRNSLHRAARRRSRRTRGRNARLPAARAARRPAARGPRAARAWCGT